MDNIRKAPGRSWVGWTKYGAVQLCFATFNFGIHLDFQGPYIDIHIGFITIVLGNSCYLNSHRYKYPCKNIGVFSSPIF